MTDSNFYLSVQRTPEEPFSGKLLRTVPTYGLFWTEDAERNRYSHRAVGVRPNVRKQKIKFLLTGSLFLLTFFSIGEGMPSGRGSLRK